MKYSIVIPTYNGEKFIYETLTSACFQERLADEIIIYDDGSKDRTLEICRSDAFKEKIQIYENKNGPSGFVNSWKKAIGKAKYNYVTLLHQDDLLHHSYLRVIENALKDYPDVRHIYSACNYIDEYGNVTREPPKPLSLEPILYSGKEYRHNYLQSVAFRRHIHRCPGVTTSRELLDICPYREEAGHIADDDFFYRIGKYTDVLGISAPLASYRAHRNSETGRLEEKEFIYRLARDYVFQCNFHSNFEYFELSDVNTLNRLAVKYINLLLRYGLVSGRKEIVTSALQFKQIFRLTSKYNIYKYSSWRYKIIWLGSSFVKKNNMNYFLNYMMKMARIKRRLSKRSRKLSFFDLKLD